MNKKNNLDEREEQQLLRIEHNGCWIAFWGLLIAMAVQSIVFGTNDFKSIAGEWIVFMALAVYISFACMKNNIWGRRLKADGKTNVLCSLIAGVIVAVLFSVIKYREYSDALLGSIAAGVFQGGFTFFTTWILLEITAHRHRNKRKKTGGLS